MRRGAAALAVAVLVAPGAAAGPTVGIPSHRTVQVGGFPTGITISRSTHTVYVGNGTTGTMSLIDASTCNARIGRSCARQVTAVTAGTDPIGIAIDESTETVYVANFSGSVAVVDGRTCDARHASGCQAALATVPVGVYPQFLAVDSRTHTVYVANSGSNTVSVIDGRSCNARSTAGCRRPRASVSVGPIPFTLAVNDRTDSVYVTDLGSTTVSVIDGATCNAADVSGCRRRPRTIDVGEAPGGIAVDRSTNTIYVTGETTNDVAVIDGRRCNASRRSGCGERPVHVAAGAGARGIALNEVTHAVYVANTAANTVTVLDGSTCNAASHRGCRRRAAVASVGLSPRRVAVDERTNTVYVTNAGSNSVTILDGRTCNGTIRTGC